MAILDDILAQIPQGAETSPWARQMLARMTSGDLVANPNDTPTPSPTPMLQPQAPPAYPSPTAPKLADQTPVPSPRMAMASGLPQIPDKATGVQTFQAGLAGFKNGGLLGGIAGAMGADDVVRERADTFRTLAANGIKPEMAALMIRSPDLFKGAYALQQQAKAEGEQNQTAAFLAKKFSLDPAQALTIAKTPELLAEYLNPLGPQSKSKPNTTVIDNRLLVDSATGKVLGNYGPGIKAEDKKLIDEANDAIQSNKTSVGSINDAIELNKVADEGPLAPAMSSSVMIAAKDALGLDTAKAKATMNLSNLLTQSALTNLKATFGAAPTEGERKILLEVQGSVDKPRDVRADILNRAKALAEQRIEYNRWKARALKSGDYYNQDAEYHDGWRPPSGTGSSGSVGGGNRGDAGNTFALPNGFTATVRR